MTRLLLQDVAKAFGSKRVLDGLDLAVEEGESLAIIGQSGSGKSVMLKCVLGLIAPDRGSIRVDGEEVVGLKGRELDRVRAKFGMLFQGGALFDSLPIWRNVTFALTQGKIGATREMRRVAEQNLERVGLDRTVLDLRPSELSGGMQKRVALARAIAPKPEIIFFDEPTTGLDPIRADAISKLIADLTEDVGITAVTITHDMHSVRTLAHRVAMLYDGKVIWNGPCEALDDSGNSYVDQFVKGLAEGPIR